jgi:hypothetical protein
MDLSKVLLESREDNFLKKYKTKFLPEDIKKIYLLSRDLSSNHKYLDFLGRIIPTENVDENLKLSKTIIEKFIKYQSQLEEKDINKYDSLESIVSTINKHENKVRRGVTKLADTDVVYEDDRFTIVSPKTYKSSCYYGAGTKWCTAAKETSGHFDSYTLDGKLFYIIDKTAKSSDPFYKVALLQKYDGEKSYWDAKDDKFNSGWLLGTAEWNEIENIITDYINTEFADQVEIFKDKERAELEKRRIRAQRERERRLALLADTNQRREDNEWSLEEYGDSDEVKKINAVFEILKNSRQIVSEDEDIYYLIPTNHENYGLLTLMWLGEEDTESTYVVGEWYEVYQAAKERQELLMYDIGLDGWNRNFVESHLDLDEVKEYIQEIFENDVRDSIETYFNNDDRELSHSQEMEILRIEEEITNLNEVIYNSEDEDEIQKVRNDIENLELEIEEIKENPDGEPSEDAIDEKIEGLVYDYMRNPMDSLREFGVDDLTPFIDLDSLIENTLDSDGLGNTLATYDGDEYDTKINGTNYFVYRTD